MTKILNLEDMLEVGHDVLDLDEFGVLRSEVEGAAQKLANAIADKLGVASGVADWQGGFGGLCAPFRPMKPDQTCPEPIDRADPSGEWE